MSIFNKFFGHFKHIGTHKGFARSEAIVFLQKYENSMHTYPDLSAEEAAFSAIKDIRNLENIELELLHKEIACEGRDSEIVTLRDVVNLHVRYQWLEKIGGKTGVERALRLAEAIPELEAGVAEIIPDITVCSKHNKTECIGSSHNPVVVAHDVKRVLIVSQSPMVSEVIRRTLASVDDLQLFATSDIINIYQSIKDINPDAIMALAEIDNVDITSLIRVIKSIDDFKRIPILVLFQEQDPAKAAACYDLNVDDCIHLLPEKTEMAARVKRAIRRNREI